MWSRSMFGSLKSRFAGIPARSPRPGACRRRPAVRLQLEALEDRTVPSTFVVTSLGDGNTGSLRDAIDQANASPDVDTIVFDPSLRGATISLSILQNISSSIPKVPQPAGPSALIITSPITIEGTGETIQRAPDARAFRLFQVTGAGNLTLHNLTLFNGLAQGGAGINRGGGAAGMGGAIYNQGTLTVLGCTLFGNQAVGGATLIDNSPTSSPGSGGGLGGPSQGDGTGGGPNGGLGTVVNGSDGGFGGGGGVGFSLGGNGGFGGGGGLSAGVGFLQGGLAGNGGFGGGGAGSLTVGGFGGSGGPGGFGGHGTGLEGGTAVAGAGSGLGGAIFNQGGAVFVANSTLTTNTAQGGNAFGTGQNGGGYGGGIFNLNGALVLTNVTIADNIVQAGTGGVINNALGGALYTASVNVGTATDSQNATADVANCIFTFQGPGSTVHNYQDTPAATGTLKASGPNIVLGLVANHNGTISGTPFTVTDPKLDLLRNNGGPTQTMALLPGSPAIDAGSNASASGLGLTTDQRGFGPRAANGTVDLGAFEVGATAPVAPPPMTPPPPPPPLPPPLPPPQLAARVVHRKGKFLVQITDGAGVLRLQRTFPVRVQVLRQDVNGDGVLDIVVVFRQGRKLRRLAFGGLDLSPLLA